MQITLVEHPRYGERRLETNSERKGKGKGKAIPLQA